jgi:cytochrome c-type biogenesis protein CcmF
VVAVIGAVEMFFLFLMVIHNNPFTDVPDRAPTDGRGLNPLLQNFYMAIHPPTMYLGFVGLTIPFAFGMAALFTGHLMTRGCAPCAAGRCSRGSSCRSASRSA